MELYDPEVPERAICRFDGIAFLAWVGITGERNSGKRRSCSAWFLVFFQQGSDVHVLKQNYAPWEVSLGGKWWLEPLVTGLYMNTVLSDDFWWRNRKYPNNNYYKFSTRVRFHTLTGQRIAFDLGPHSPFVESRRFYELSTVIFTPSVVPRINTWEHGIYWVSFGVKLHIIITLPSTPHRELEGSWENQN